MILTLPRLGFFSSFFLFFFFFLGGGGGQRQHRKFFNFQPFDCKLSTILLSSILDQNPKKIKMAEYFLLRHRLCNGGGMDKKISFEAKFSLAPNFQPLDFKLFHNTSLIYS